MVIRYPVGSLDQERGRGNWFYFQFLKFIHFGKSIMTSGLHSLPMTPGHWQYRWLGATGGTGDSGSVAVRFTDSEAFPEAL